MRSTISFALALAGASALSSGAHAASTVFGGSATLRAGYGKNPSFGVSQNGTSGVVGGDLTATLARITGTGRTALTGTADITQPTSNGGRSDNFQVQLSHAQQFSPKLSLSGDVRYQDSTNPGAVYSTDSRDLTAIGDVLTIGTHSRAVSGDLNVGYQLDSKDLIQGGLNASHTSYSTANASAFTQYGASIGYLRTISAATRIGVQLSALKVDSSQFASSSSYTGGLVLTQKVGKFWTFQGGVNGVLQKAFGGSFKTIGFNGSLCGDYPRYTVCVLGSRQSAASGIGGLRIDTQGGARVNYKLTALSTLDLEVTYDVSTAKDVALPTQHYIDAALSYRRTITPRLSAGVSGRYQRRTGGFIDGGRQTSYVGTADIVYSFGRTS